MIRKLLYICTNAWDNLDNSGNAKHEREKIAPCEDRTHDLQISTFDYETDALPTALTRRAHLQLGDIC